MAFSEFIEKAQARLHAQSGQWGNFSATVSILAGRSTSPESADKASWLAELWVEFALTQNHQRLLEYSRWLVTNRDQASHRLPSLSTLVDAASKEPRLQWILERPELHEIWIAATEVPVPNKEWRSHHHVVENVFASYTAWMQAQPALIQERQKTYLAQYGTEALQGKSLLYYAMCAYGTPTKEQVRAAALANNPVYDMVRLEEHYPGIGGLRAMYEGMGLKTNALRDALCSFMDGKNSKPEEAIPEQGFDAH